MVRVAGSRPAAGFSIFSGNGGMSTPRILCLTADGLPHSHVEQVQDFCFAGAEWIQLRSKQLSDCELEPIAFEALQVCRQYGSRLLINDRLDLALKIEADGAFGPSGWRLGTGPSACG